MVLFVEGGWVGGGGEKIQRNLRIYQIVKGRQTI